jgi:hypothetical protein
MQDLRGTIDRRITFLDESHETVAEHLSSLGPEDTAQFDVGYLQLDGLDLSLQSRGLTVTPVGDASVEGYNVQSDMGVSTYDSIEAAQSFIQTEILDARRQAQRIQQQVGIDEVKRALREMDFDTVTVVLEFNEHSNRTAVWKYQQKQLEVDLPAEPQTVDQFETVMQIIRQRAEHETQHVGQYVLRDLKGLDELGGLPPDEVRNPNWTPEGYRGPNRRRRRKDHPLRDMEYHTRLKDEIDILADSLEQIPRDLRREMIRVWIQDKEDMSDRLSEAVDVLNLKPSGRTFFRSMKRREPDKWQEAVKEVWNGVQERDIVIP